MEYQRLQISEYTKQQIQEALTSENPYDVVPSRDENGHGTDLAGVAAGSSIGNGVVYLGAAPECDIVVVKLKECKPHLRDYYLLPQGVPAYAENDIMLGVKYAESFAETFSRPVVICIGLGTNMGGHTGSSPLSRYLDTIAIRRSRAVVVCGGNEGNAAHHYEGKLTPRVDATSSYDDVEIRVGDSQQGFFLELWGCVPDLFNIAIRSPGGEMIPPLRLGIDQDLVFNFIYDRTIITVSSVLVEESSGDELLILRFQNPTPGVWTA